MWSNELDSVLAEFKAKAERAKQEHHAKYPDYQYQPRKRVSSACPASTILSNLKTKGGRRATLPLSKESKKKIAEQNKTSKTDTLEEPQELGSSWGLSDYAQSLGDLDAGFFDMPKTVDNNNNNFPGALDETDLLGQDSYLDDIRTIFDPLNSFEPSPTAMRSASIYAASQGWTI
jgi:hypothetical protein